MSDVPWFDKYSFAAALERGDVTATPLPPERPANWHIFGGLLYPHACGGTCLSWETGEGGLLCLECDCGKLPVDLAADLGIPTDKLHPVELRHSARVIAERTLASDPGNRTALSTLAFLGT